MKDFEKIEHLLLSKRFEELSPTEMKEVTGYFENAIDYNDMRDTLMQVKSTLAADKLLIKPNVELKEKLLQKFDNTYTNHSSASLGKRRPFYKNIGFQWSAAATVVILISLSIFGYIQNINSKAKDGISQNYQTPASKDYVNKVPDEEVSGGENEKDKTKITTIEPELGELTVSEDEINEPNVARTATIDELGEGELNKNYETKNGFINFGSVRSENTTIPVTTDNTTLKTESNEQKIDNSALYKNGFTITDNDDYRGDLIQGNANDTKKDDKNNDPQKTIPVQTQNIINYSVNNRQSNTNSDYWRKNKNKEENKKPTIQVNLGLAQEKRLEADSAQVRLDSLQLDSNLQRARMLDLDKNK